MRAPSHKTRASSEPAASLSGGNRDSFRAIVETHRREITLHCYRFIGSLHDGEDLAQETFLRAWQGIDEAMKIAAGCPGLDHGFAVDVCRPFVTE
jgi:Sigma-70 region 2